MLLTSSVETFKTRFQFDAAEMEYDSSTYDFKIETLNELPTIVGSDIL
jgi:hypothetical protein